ncbi:E3 ubiquitin-protein ligase RBBP6-like [Amia ocellicauda]|uniref:E3 ubiquitin-protein ligase RBBP6-like n=1 Tax=Amia ocellicauda TaxID=2972642 RepID=UPI003463E569
MVRFEGLYITLSDLKRQIMAREKLKAKRCGLQADDSPASNALAQLCKISDLTEANVSEEDKISAMMFQSTHQYHPIHYVKDPEGTPPPNYTCFRCGVKGHYIRNCPTIGDPDFKPLPRIRKSAGIPRSFLVEVSDSSVKGAMLTSTGSYAIPTIAMEAYATGKKEKHPFLVQEQSSPPTEGDPVPAELLCLLCEELLVDAVVIPCCGTNYCDECIRTCLIDSDEHECPTCHKLGVSPDSLEANQVLRKVGLFLIITNGPAVMPTQPGPEVQRPASPPASRQQDPQVADVARGRSHSARSRSRSHGERRSRSRSPGVRRGHANSRKTAPAPQSEGGRKCMGRYREAPWDAQARNGRPVGQREPFEREQRRQWERERERERESREWGDRDFNRHYNPPGNREPVAPKRFAPAQPWDDTPYSRGWREGFRPF